MTEKDHIIFQTESKKIGGSLWTRIPAKIAFKHRIIKNQLFDVTLSRSAHLGAIPLVLYRCKSCERQFTQAELEPYCPACGCENLEIKETEENFKDILF